MKENYKLFDTGGSYRFGVTSSKISPEFSEKTRARLREIDNRTDRHCVTITIPTHRTKPEYEQDPVLLNRLVGEALDRLAGTQATKEERAAVERNLLNAAASVDFAAGLDGLAVFASEKFSDSLQVPVPLTEYCTVAGSFDTEPLTSALDQTENYYIIHVSRKKIRLFRLTGMSEIAEIHDGDFPWENDDYWTDDPQKLMQDDFTDNLIKEFFNVSDKKFQKKYNRLPLAAVVMGDVKSSAYYMEQMDDRRMVIGYVPGNHGNAKPEEILEAALPLLSAYREQGMAQLKDRLNEAASAGLLETDPEKIAYFAQMQNCAYLYVSSDLGREDLDLPQNLTAPDGSEIPATVTNLNEIMLAVWQGSGQVLFTEPGIMDEYNGLALVRRY